jgi:hypothetical protein
MTSQKAVPYLYPVHMPSSSSCHTDDTHNFFHCTSLNTTHNNFHIYLQHILLSTSANVYCWQGVAMYITGLSHSKQLQTAVHRYFFHICTVHIGIIKVFYSPTDGQVSCLQPNSAMYIHQQGPSNTYSHITTVLTTNRYNLVDYFNKCNFSKHEKCAP